MNCIGTYDGTIFYNPANKFCIVSVKTADQSVPAEARSNRRYKDHLIRFTAVGYEIPRTDAVELELDGEWTKGKYGVQLQVEQWREIVPRTKNGVEGYLASGLIKGIGPKTAADIVERFGVDTLDILEHQPERLLEIRGITESKLEGIKASYAENRMLQGIMTLRERSRKNDWSRKNGPYRNGKSCSNFITAAPNLWLNSLGDIIIRTRRTRC